MESSQFLLLERRKADFEKFYTEMMPVIVEFVDQLGIKPAHHVLNHALEYAPHMDRALQDLTVESEDRIWLITRLGYFIGEYIAQKYDGCWFVNDDPDSIYFARYVVGKFQRLSAATEMVVDPFHFAQIYVDIPVPRYLSEILVDVERSLK